MKTQEIVFLRFRESAAPRPWFNVARLHCEPEQLTAQSEVARMQDVCSTPHSSDGSIDLNIKV